MNARTKIVLRLALAVAALAALVPTAALAQPLLDDYDGWWGYSDRGSYSGIPTWCHTGDFGATALSDRVTVSRVAGALGLTPAKLAAELRNGNTVADIAAERDVKLQAAVDAALGRHRDIVRWRVEDGYVTQSRADAVLGLMDEQIRQAFELGVDQGLGSGPGYYRAGPGYPGDGGFRMGPGMMGGWGPGWGSGGMMGGW